ncbi:CDP-glucose 4,6-dehydratase [Psychroflexus lacisalsi]|uniref:CDP-glucose 4,6-dehydratase n=1 Tax=Psychroflexus lacisalsi TaxID=503928 RepID=A0ABP3VFW4_9FLAO|nr:CDP-glucose 4,6-dehydratase [Psychroflexus lacisalsi]MBZ9618857.1 CDP-glucose 4,6-dehydratase [Psychroflexus lacisalsi]
MDKLQQFYKDKRVLITGHTGFKGSWLSILLKELGATVIGYSLDPYTQNDNFVLSEISKKIIDVRGDICNRTELQKVFDEYKPDIVLHLAAQALVRYSYDNPIETYETNVMGSINVMEAFRKCTFSRVAVMVTTDKCYENKEQFWGYRENEAMGGYDPYSSSKGSAEIAISSWRRSFMNPDKYDNHGKSIASVRAGNVIGGGDWIQDRIIPDCIKALESNKTIEIRNPNAIRPWQHVLEPLCGYLMLAQKMWESPTQYCEGWNFGPHSESIDTVWSVATKAVENFGSGEIKDVSSAESLHEATLLMLDISKAKFKLGWEPRMNLDQTIEMTIDWYKKYKTQHTYELCVDQIKKYFSL